MIVCEGCFQDFASFANLARHLRQTTSADCVALWDAIRQKYNSSSEEMEEDEHCSPTTQSDRSSALSVEVPNIFEGDFFGNNYFAADFPGWDDEAVPYLELEPDNSNGSHNEHGNTHYEPDLPDDLPPEGPPPINEDVPPCPLHDPQHCRSQVEDPLSGWQPPVCVRYPGSNAGKVLRHEASTLTAMSKSLDKSNPFHPFRHEMDWEMAKWAKSLG
jgi:hypothetical protein